MKKITLLAVLIAMLIVCNSCEKNKSVDNFVGTYNITIDYDTYVDGEYAESGCFEGTLSITAIDKTTVRVEGIVNFSGGNAALYETTGSVDNNGVLHLEASTYDKGTVPIEVSYGDINYKSPLTFNSSMSTYLQGYELFYEMTNTATKK